MTIFNVCVVFLVASATLSSVSAECTPGDCDSGKCCGENECCPVPDSGWKPSVRKGINQNWHEDEPHLEHHGNHDDKVPARHNFGGDEASGADRAVSFLWATLAMLAVAAIA
jgi:hypothetical protein